MIEVGLARTDITVFEPGMAMMGWGQLHCQAHTVGMPLHARAVAVRGEDGSRFVFVVVELLLVTQGLWLGVLQALEERHPSLGLDANNVTITATHTHSGPSGYGHHFWVNLNAPGFSAQVYDGLVDGVVDAIVAACADLAPARLVLSEAVVPKEAGVAFNRSWFAHNLNHEVQGDALERRGEAVARTMTMVRVESPDGELRGLVDWFGLHGTCVHADNQAMHPDHKGLLAEMLERDGGIALCVQGCCGDVSPNHRPSDRGHTVGVHDDDLESARLVAEAQAHVARALLATEGRELTGAVSAKTVLVDFSCAPAEARFTAVDGPRHTSPARLGISMAMGTAEGPGPLRPVRRVLAAMHRLMGRWREDPKLPLVDLARGTASRVLGVLPMAWMPPADPIFRWIGTQVRGGLVNGDSWVPQVLPVQLMQVGSLLICAVPFEVTTIAGERLRRSLLEAAPGVTDVVISGYANAYVGYLTTYEEYRVQHYEAGYTLFGPHTLAALRTAAVELAAGAEVVSAPLPTPAHRERLDAIAFQGPWST